MGSKRHTAEEIIGKLRQAEVALAQGMAVPDVCRRLGVAEQTYYRWRKEYGGLCRRRRSARGFAAGDGPSSAISASRKR